MATAPTRRRRVRDVERTLSPRRLARLLRRLADAIEQERVCRIRIGRESVAVPPTAAIQIEHERTASREQIELELEWPVKRVRKRA